MQHSVTLSGAQSNGKAFLDGKTLTAFSNDEEEELGLANNCASPRAN
jgi:hypothetical protein